MDMTADQTLQESCMGALQHMGVEVRALIEKANRLEDENARLREQVDAAHMSRLLTENENEKLRELCAGLLTGYECGFGELCKGCTWDGVGDSKTFSCLPRAIARDLGVEVTS